MNHELQAIEDGDTCPHCGRNTIESIRAPNLDGNTCMNEMHCTECDGYWMETYTLTKVEAL